MRIITIYRMNITHPFASKKKCTSRIPSRMVIPRIVRRAPVMKTAIAIKTFGFVPFTTKVQSSFGEFLRLWIFMWPIVESFKARCKVSQDRANW